MFKKFVSILFAVLLQCLLPLAHANSSNLDVQVTTLYTSENVSGSVLPHFLNNPGFGGKLLLEHSDGTIDFDAALGTVQANMQDGQSDLIGHTGVSIGVGGKVGIVHLSGQQSYMHVNQGGTDFFQGDVYETLVKAELTAGAQRPYIFTGLIVPAYVPIERVIGMSGFGLVTQTPVYSDAAWSVGIHTDSSIATSLLNINREEETMVRTRFAMQAQGEGTPLEMGFGFNLYQDIRRKEYTTWWDFTLSYMFR